jgi:Gamma-glutamyl phosphate reductase
MKNYLNNIGIKSKNAFKNLGYVGLKKRNNVLENYIKSLKTNKNKIIKENLKDIKLCKREELIDRLIIDNKKIENMRNSIYEIIKFKDPLGKVLEKWKRPNNLVIKKVTIPIGVIGIIYESRPDVTQ